MRTTKSFVFLSALLIAGPAYAQDPPPAEAPPAAAAEPEAEPAAEEPPAATDTDPARPPARGAATTSVATPATPPAQTEQNTQVTAQGRRGGGDAGSRPNPVSRSGEDDSSKEWSFDYHGYLRAPFRVGIGSRTNRYCLDNGGAETIDCPADAVPKTSEQSGTTFHRPLVPDDQYLSWQYSGHQKGDWAEMFFSMGNDVVTGTLSVQGYQFTDGSWKNDTAQFGIGQGWIEFNSDLGYENIHFNAKAGSFWARYGMAGRYDAGEYDTYLFGRTHTMGGMTRVEVGLDPEYTLGLEGGFGARRPNPSIYNRSRFTMLAHAHADINWVDEVEFSAHLMHSFSQTEQGIMQEGATFDDPTDPLVARPNGSPHLLYAEATVDDTTPDGSMMVWGADARLDLDMAGYLYAGFSQIRANTAFTVAPAIEVMHSFGGGEYTSGVIDNYLESPFCANNGYGDMAPGIPIGLDGTCSDGTGTVNSFLAQYELSLANFGLFEGGQDLKMKFFGMLNLISVDDRESFEVNTYYNGREELIDDHSQDGTRKLKFGGDFEYVILPWLSAGLRADRIQPHSKIPEQSFTVMSPRIVFRSDFVTREAVTIQYTRYFYEQRECAVGNPAADPFYTNAPPVSTFNDTNSDGLPGRIFCVQPPSGPSLPDGFGAHGNNGEEDERGAPSTRPDLNTISVQATMWW